MNHSSFLSLGVALALTLGACGPGQDGDATGGAGGGGDFGGALPLFLALGYLISRSRRGSS